MARAEPMRQEGPKIGLAKTARSPYWVIRYEDDPETGHISQFSTGTVDKREAERQLGEFRSDVLNARYQGRANAAWDVFREKYEKEALPGLAEKTRRKSYTVLDSVEQILKPRKLGDLTASRISKWVAELREGGRAESTIAGYVAHLRASLSWAVSVGMIPVVPKIQRPKRAKVYRKSKGRAPTEEEFKRYLEAVPTVVGTERAESWQHLINGLWWGGLRLGEALELWWDRDDKLRIDLTGDRPVLHIPAELEKGHQDRLLPIAPEFAEFLLQTPQQDRKGLVFRPQTIHNSGPTPNHVIKILCAIGKQANVIVHVEARTGKIKYASAHDFRRAFGDRWALRVMPPVLMQLMRHESIETTMKYYVGRSVEATADVVWQAYHRSVENGQAAPVVRNQQKGECQKVIQQTD